ncbi:hypothetical protein KM043_004451 [Ampulex compressa]|nr:hypothetical protein KM043_004451 [Ampulex compressa]
MRAACVGPPFVDLGMWDSRSSLRIDYGDDHDGRSGITITIIADNIDGRLSLEEIQGSVRKGGNRDVCREDGRMAGDEGEENRPRLLSSLGLCNMDVD